MFNVDLNVCWYSRWTKFCNSMAFRTLSESTDLQAVSSIFGNLGASRLSFLSSACFRQYVCLIFHIGSLGCVGLACVPIAPPQEKFLAPGKADECEISDALHSLFQHAIVQQVMREKGFADVNATMDRLKSDTDGDGKLKNPSAWGIPCSEGGGDNSIQPPKTKSGKTIAEEDEVWAKAKENDFKIKARGGAGNPLASRFDRMLKAYGFGNCFWWLDPFPESSELHSTGETPSEKREGGREGGRER
jgi:hypothetical protein